MEIFRELIKIDGVKTLFKGFNASILYAFSVNAAIFYGYEFTHFYLDKFLKK